MKKKFVGVDFDRTLSKKEGVFRSPDFIGEPIPAMVEMVKLFLKKGIEVKIFTARVSKEWPEDRIKIAEEAINKFCVEHFGRELEITADKSPYMGLIIDDKAVSIRRNYGYILNSNEIWKLIEEALNSFETVIKE